MGTLAALLALAAVLVGLGAVQSWFLLEALGEALLLTIALSFAWSRWSVRGIYVRPRPRAIRLQVGDTLEERFEIENLSWVPKLWLEVLDTATHPEHNLSQVVSLGPKGRRVRVFRTPCRRRGKFRLGPVTLAAGDPFGFFSRERELLGESSLLVYPPIVPLDRLRPLPGDLAGGTARGERVHYLTPSVASVRDYEPGDPFSRIHWTSSLRLNRLMVKEFERDPFTDVWLILDLDRHAQVGHGAVSTTEMGVAVCASLAAHFLREGRAVGIVAASSTLAADRGTRQHDRMLELLATVQARSGALSAVLLSLEGRLTGHQHLVVVTPTTDISPIAQIGHLARRGLSASVVLLDPATFGQAPSQAAVVGELLAARIPTYRVGRESALAEALSRPLAQAY
ncbi:MAG: DUF58 domain-containing protein [Chloroflexi bacterium]|nr:DUF58 domain-containing protein [Chloroflexota bacterium]